MKLLRLSLLKSASDSLKQHCRHIIFVINLLYISIFEMGQEMCCQGDRPREFNPTSLKRISRPGSTSKQKYLESQIPDFKMEYVEQKKKTLDRYIVKNRNLERGKQFGPYEVSQSGVVYVGEWRDGQPHGLGQLFFRDGSYFYGTFANGFVHGQGRFISATKSYYEGQVRHNVAEGKGIYINDQQGYKYKGEWMNDLPNGQGKQEWEEGTKYQGHFVNGAKNGEGFLKFGADGSEYRGFFKNDEFHGTGELKLPEGTYKGSFDDGKMQGKGVFKFKDGSVYDGEYKNNRKHGYGKYIKNDMIYQGKWQGGMRHGEGYLTNENGVITKGNWVRGQGYYT